MYSMNKRNSSTDVVNKWNLEKEDVQKLLGQAIIHQKIIT